MAARGRGQGSNPYDLLLAGLGTCTAMTLRLYAERKQWPLAEVRVHLFHTRPAPPAKRIDRRLELTGLLTGEQRARPLEIASRCPVHRTLQANVPVTISLAENTLAVGVG